MKYPYVATSSIVVIHVNGKQYSVGKEHPNFDEIRQFVDFNDHTGIEPLLDITAVIEAVDDFSIGCVESQGDVVLYKGQPLDTTLTRRIIRLHQSGEPINKMVAFLTNLMDNPSSSAVTELYDFLHFGDLPITEDGHFLAYKNLRQNYFDIYTNTIDNSVGETVSMQRNLVDDDRDSTCSHGLHFCSKSYLGSYRVVNGGKTVILKINPKNVVTIPSDYTNTKGRCCEYEVLADLADYHDAMVFSKPIVDDSKIKLTVRQAIAVQTVNNALKLWGYVDGVNTKKLSLKTLIKDDNVMYKAIVNELRHAFDVEITEDRAVKHYKFVKNYVV